MSASINSFQTQSKKTVLDFLRQKTCALQAEIKKYFKKSMNSLCKKFEEVTGILKVRLNKVIEKKMNFLSLRLLLFNLKWL